MEKTTTPQTNDTTLIAELSTELAKVAEARRDANERDYEIGRSLMQLGVSSYRIGQLTGLTRQGARKRYRPSTHNRKE